MKEPELSQFDKENIGLIVNGHGRWFSAMLIRLIAKADMRNRECLKEVFPNHVKAYEDWVLTSMVAE